MGHHQNLKHFVVAAGMRGRSRLIVQLWWIVQASLFRWSPQVLYGWRRFLLRLFSAKIGVGVLVRPSATITYPWKVSIGDYSWIGDDVVLYSLGEIQIGENSVVSQRSYLCAGSHDYKKESFDLITDKIIIEDEVWLATDVFVAPGVEIAKGAVIGARSSVFSNIPTEMICFGNPAKPVRSRYDENINLRD